MQPRRSKSLSREATGPERRHLASHPDFASDILVSDEMTSTCFIHANKAQIGCTLGTEQPPRSDRLSHKKKEYKSILTSTKFEEAMRS